MSVKECRCCILLEKPCKSLANLAPARRRMYLGPYTGGFQPSRSLVLEFTALTAHVEGIPALEGHKMISISCNEIFAYIISTNGG